MRKKAQKFPVFNENASVTIKKAKLFDECGVIRSPFHSVGVKRLGIVGFFPQIGGEVKALLVMEKGSCDRLSVACPARPDIEVPVLSPAEILVKATDEVKRFPADSPYGIHNRPIVKRSFVISDADPESTADDPLGNIEGRGLRVVCEGADALCNHARG